MDHYAEVIIQLSVTTIMKKSGFNIVIAQLGKLIGTVSDRKVFMVFFMNLFKME